MRTPIALAALLALAAPAAAHEGNPKYSSVVTGVTPRTPGLEVRVLDHDDALALVNRGDATVVVLGDAGEPYARVLADGTVQVNERSPAAAEEEHEHERRHEATAPAGPPRWRTLDRTGRLEWHDHRIHYRGHGLPPQVTDASERTLVRDWRVPLRVGGRPGAIAGTLTWLGESDGSGFPTGAVVSLVAAALLALTAVVLVRRRRAEAER